MSLKDLCTRYHRHQLHKEAGFWADWGNGIVEGWLAGSDLYKTQAKMTPIRVRRADGTFYYRMPSSKYQNNRDIANLVYDADTGTYETLERAKQRQRAQELKQEWQAFERKQIPELMKRGMTRERAYMELDSLRDNAAAQASERGLKRAKDYLSTVDIPGGR